MTHLRGLSLVLPLLALGACAGPVTHSPQANAFDLGTETAYERQLAFEQLMKDRDRIFNVAFPLMAANAEFCAATEARAGFTVWSSYSIGSTYHDAAKAAYNLQGHLALQFVADQSPAGRAGLRSGDSVVSVNGQDIPTAPGAHKQVAKIVEAAGLNPFPMTVTRAGQTINVTIKPVLACTYPVLFTAESTEINAHTDGESIFIDKGMLRFTNGDDELALIIAHELGHITMHHTDKKRSNAVAGYIGGALLDAAVLAATGGSGVSTFSQTGARIGVRQHSVAFEQEADYVGLYYAARAGYDTSKVAGFWRRMAADAPSDLARGETHPASPERFVALDKTHQEILQKIAAKVPLTPNLAPKK